MSTEYNITATQGNNLNLRFAASDASGNAIDLTQYTVSGVVRLKYSDTGVLLDLQPTIHTSYVSGLIDVSVPASGITGLPVTQAFYDIKIYHTTTGCSSEVVRGYFNILPATTI